RKARWGARSHPGRVRTPAPHPGPLPASGAREIVVVVIPSSSEDAIEVGASGKVQCFSLAGRPRDRQKGRQPMAANYSLCLGTAGWGVWHSPDAGQSWTRHRAPFPLNSRIQALVAHPTQAHTVLAGGDTGLFASHDGGARWERLGANGALPTIWSLTVDPVDPDILFVGTRPAGVYRSRDGGRQWE